MHRLHAIVKGVVQGVNFRHFTRVQAQGLGLQGWVRNLPDGTVELIAEGSQEALYSLLAALHRGPSSARVEDIAIEWQDATGEFDSFRVRYS